MLPYVKGYEDPRRRMAYQEAIWVGSGQGAIDETKEIIAAQRRIDAGLSSRTIETAEIKGTSWKSVLKQLKREKLALERAGISLISSPDALNSSQDAGNEVLDEATLEVRKDQQGLAK